MDLRDLIAETLAQHGARNMDGVTIACWCSWLSDLALDAAKAEHRRHVADVLLAAIGERADHRWAVEYGGQNVGVDGWRHQATSEVEARTWLVELAGIVPNLRLVRGDVLPWRPVDTEDPPPGTHRAEGAPMSYPHLSTDCDEHHDLVRDFGGARPTITVLCGSTRFGHTFREQNLRLTMAGHIVLSIGCDTRSDHELWRDLDQAAMDALKADLDDLHKRKIDLADEVFILNVGGYIGESTRSEIEYANKVGRPVSYLEEIGVC